MAALSTADVLLEEARTLHGNRALRDGISGRELNQTLNSLLSSALCLSGGGIRSASFSLGVIQAFACHPRTAPNGPVQLAENSLLAKFKYLSTVSGGGYIGGFLSAWLARAHLAAPNGWEIVWQKLTGRRGNPEDEATELSWLRNYSNYLTPRLGMASADLWATVAISVRNLTLNWLVIIPVVCAVLLALKLVALVVGWFAGFDPLVLSFVYASGTFGVGCALFALWFTSRQRPTHGRSTADQGAFLQWDLVPATLAGVFFTLALAFSGAEEVASSVIFPDGRIAATGLGEFALFGFVLFALAWLLSYPRCSSVRDGFFDWLWWSLSGLIYGAFLAVGIYSYFTIATAGLWLKQPPEILLLICGVPWALLSHLAAEIVFVGLSSYEDRSDSDREWLGRAAGWYMTVALGWLLVMFLVLIGSKLVGNLYAQISTGLIGSGAGVITAILGKSAATPAQGSATKTAGISANLMLGIAAPILAGALVIGLSSLLDHIIFGNSFLDNAAFHSYVVLDALPPWYGNGVVLALVIAIGIAAIASATVNINRFSLHALYRNRIIRAFLGASNPDRITTRNLFTDFDDNDNLRVYDLWPPETAPGVPAVVGPANWRPFHIINIALNIVSAKRLAWQERKAEPFFASPLHTGSSCLGFRYTATYGDKKGISLGTAVAISGAAASPNMGYHSSPPLAFLLTMLNVRLGWWLGNPGPAGEKRETYKEEGPPTAIGPLVSEMFGQTTDDQDYVYLSDGGHFENLGLYEMVRRRCRYIVVVDAGCDKDFAFEDLGNAVRKISLDLGVEITFRGLNSILFRADAGQAYPPLAPPFHAIGTINYPAADSGGEVGTILYIKPAFHVGRISNVGVRNYAVSHPEFPHESTSDQWFSESQLESYRALGFEITDSILTQALAGANLPPNATMAQVFHALSLTMP